MNKLIIAALVAAVIPATVQAQSCQSIAQSVFTSVFTPTAQMEHPTIVDALVKSCTAGVMFRDAGKTPDAVIDSVNSLVAKFNLTSPNSDYSLGTTAGALAVMQGYMDGDK